MDPIQWPLGHTKNVVFLLTRLTLSFSPDRDPRNFIDPLKKKNLICSKNTEHIFVLQPVQRYGQFCMCTEAPWIQEIKPLLNSMKILIIVFEFAMYSLELEITFKKKNYFRPTYPIFFSQR
jgi:hypothetical protein